MCKNTFPSLIKMKQISPREIRIYYFDNNVHCPYCGKYHDAPMNIHQWSEHYNTLDIAQGEKLKRHLSYNYFDYVGEDGIKIVSEKEEDIFVGLEQWLQERFEVYNKNKIQLKIHEAALENLIKRVKKGEVQE